MPARQAVLSVLVELVADVRKHGRGGGTHGREAIPRKQAIILPVETASPRAVDVSRDLISFQRTVTLSLPRHNKHLKVPIGILGAQSRQRISLQPVSYTHLTLPTILLV